MAFGMNRVELIGRLLVKLVLAIYCPITLAYSLVERSCFAALA